MTARHRRLLVRLQRDWALWLLPLTALAILSIGVARSLQ